METQPAKTESSSRSRTAVDAKRGTIFMVDPADLVLVTDEKHPLFDPRVNLPIDETLMASIEASGVLAPIRARKNGDKLEVIVGRQRVKATRKLNESRDGNPILVPCVVTRGTDSELYAEMVAENVARRQDTPTMVAWKLQRGLRYGLTEQSWASTLGVSVETIKNRLKLLDAHPDVQKAVDSGVIGEAVARKLVSLDRDEQKKTLDEMIATGATKGAKARQKAEKKTGKKSGPRGLTQKQVKTWLDELAQVEHDQIGAAVAVLNAVLGDDDLLVGRYKKLRPSWLSE